MASKNTWTIRQVILLLPKEPFPIRVFFTFWYAGHRGSSRPPIGIGGLTRAMASLLLGGGKLFGASRPCCLRHGDSRGGPPLLGLP